MKPYHKSIEQHRVIVASYLPNAFDHLVSH